MTTYPHLFRVDGRHLPGVPRSLQAEITSACRQIERRTGTSAWYHVPLQTVQYHIGAKPRGGPAESLVFQGDRYIKINVNNTCERIYGARVAAHKKTQAINEAYAESKRKMAEEIQKHNDDVRPERIDFVKYQMNKRNHGRHSRNQVLT